MPGQGIQQMGVDSSRRSRLAGFQSTLWNATDRKETKLLHQDTAGRECGLQERENHVTLFPQWQSISTRVKRILGRGNQASWVVEQQCFPGIYEATENKESGDSKEDLATIGGKGGK